MSESPGAYFTLRSTNGVTIVTFINPKVVLDVRGPLYDLVEKEGHKRLILNSRERELSLEPVTDRGFDPAQKEGRRRWGES